MFDIGLPEVVIILVVVAIFFFGGKRISEFARSLGRFTGEFKKGKAEMEQELGTLKGKKDDKKQG
ncbi:MAG: twin-arginine translocase TatA/TatE family subunit [Candidatus Nomurabacteria bacterium]|nr:twin-arginine translocase TatA/TatE family subunit [Candidatus Nomurabacteria bacterium]